MKQEFVIPSTPDEILMTVALIGGVVAVAGVLYGLNMFMLSKRWAAMKTLAERLRFERLPAKAEEDIWEVLHQGWLLRLSMPERALRRRSVYTLPTLHVELGLEFPGHLEAVPKAWEWQFGGKDLARCFKMGNEALDKRFDWLCARAEQPQAQALLGKLEVQRALMALGSGDSALVRIEKNQVALVFEHNPDEASLVKHMNALTAVATALRQALVPARDEVRRNA